MPTSPTIYWLAQSPECLVDGRLDKDYPAFQRLVANMKYPRSPALRNFSVSFLVLYSAHWLHAELASVAIICPVKWPA
jgi:hypothetical protein